jgi:uncharacterized repeat protein (TIGR04138 family)
MQPLNFDEVLERILEQDRRYRREAYLFLREGLEYTQRQIVQSQSKKAEPRHVTGKELLDGLRLYGLAQFGPMTATVLGEWGIRACEDFGELVFNMVDQGLLSRTDSDSREDFKGGYTFEEAFCRPFLPAGKKVESAPSEPNLT